MPLKKTNKVFIPILTVMLAGLVSVSPFAIDTYLAAMPNMAIFFGVNISTIELTITLYFLGFAIGNFFGGPLSDAFGRKTIALTGIALYGLSSLVIPQCTSVEQVLILRVIQAFGGGFATVTANIFVRDWFEGKQVAKFVTIISMIMMLAPLFAPIIGAFIIKANGWQGVFYFLFFFSAVMFLLFLFLIPESRDKALITKRITFSQLFNKYKVFFSDKFSVIMLLTVSFSMSGLYLFITSASFIYIEYFGIKAEHFPIYFGSNVIFNVFLSFINTILLKYYSPKQMLRVGLIIQLISGIVLAVSVIIQPNLWVTFACIVIYIGCLGLIFGNGTAVILNKNPKVSGSANATIGITRFLMSFIIGSAIALFHTGNLLPVGIAMFCCVLIANILFYQSLKLKD